MPAEFCGDPTCDLAFRHEHTVFTAPNGREVAAIVSTDGDPNAEVRDPDTGEVIFRATKQPLRLITGGKDHAR